MAEAFSGSWSPSTNTTGEIEYLPPARRAAGAYGAASARVGTRPFSPSKDADVAYQAKLLGDARVEVIALAQNLGEACFSDDYDDVTVKRMTEGLGCGRRSPPAQAIGRALKALKASRIAIATHPIRTRSSDGAPALLPDEVRHRQRSPRKSLGAHQCLRHRQDGTPAWPRRRFRRIDRPEVDALVVPGGKLPDHGLDRRLGAHVRQAGDHHQPGGVVGGAADHEVRPASARQGPAARAVASGLMTRG